MSGLLPVSWKSGWDHWRSWAPRVFSRRLPERSRETTSDDLWRLPALLSGAAGPAVDIVDREDEVVVTAELPGLEQNDSEVSVEADRLILQGEKKASRKRKEGAYTYRESSWGSFYRALPLPAEVDRDKAEAQYKHGVLTVRLPKTEKSKSKRITVKVT